MHGWPSVHLGRMGCHVPCMPSAGVWATLVQAARPGWTNPHVRLQHLDGYAAAAKKTVACKTIHKVGKWTLFGASEHLSRMGAPCNVIVAHRTIATLPMLGSTRVHLQHPGTRSSGPINYCSTINHRLGAQMGAFEAMR